MDILYNNTCSYNNNNNDTCLKHSKYILMSKTSYSGHERALVKISIRLRACITSRLIWNK